MINPFAEINWKPEREEILSFGKTMLIGFSIISVIFLIVNLFRLSFEQALILPVYLFSVGSILFLIANIGGFPAKFFYLLWYALAASVGIVISNLFLALFYYLFFSLFAVIFRAITGRDPLRLKKDENAQSYWINTTGKKSIKSYFKQY